jgi:methylmalonyl-CoA epimerase
MKGGSDGSELVPSPPGAVPSALDHLGIAVSDLDEAVADYGRLLGVEPVHRERVEDQGVEEVLLAVGDSFIQLLSALGPDTPVGRFLRTRGPGLHHVAYRVEDIEAALAQMRSDGARMIDEHGRRGSRGTTIAFIHPESLGGVLIELVQRA